MAENSKIEWTHHTANLWWGCQKVHAGCDNCYAETLDNRYNHDAPHWGPHAPRKMVNSVWKDLAKFQRDAAAENTVKRVFVGSMMDIFEKPMPLVDNKNQPISLTTGDLRNRFFEDVVPNSPNLQFLLLSKRPGNILKYIPPTWTVLPPTNVIYGYSVVDQATTDGIDDLLAVPGRHFLSMEPLLDRVDLSKWLWTGKWMPTYQNPDNSGCEEPVEPLGLIDWVIVGGESGDPKKIRPMNNEWAEEIKDQCERAQIPFFYKQWGEWMPLQIGEVLNYAADQSGKTYFYDKSIDHRFRRDNDRVFYLGGKHNNGSLLAGKEYKNFPRV